MPTTIASIPPEVHRLIFESAATHPIAPLATCRAWRLNCSFDELWKAFALARFPRLAAITAHAQSPRSWRELAEEMLRAELGPCAYAMGASLASTHLDVDLPNLLFTLEVDVGGVRLVRWTGRATFGRRAHSQGFWSAGLWLDDVWHGRATTHAERRRRRPLLERLNASNESNMCAHVFVTHLGQLRTLRLYHGADEEWDPAGSSAEHVPSGSVIFSGLVRSADDVESPSLWLGVDFPRVTASLSDDDVACECSARLNFDTTDCDPRLRQELSPEQILSFLRRLFGSF